MYKRSFNASSRSARPSSGFRGKRRPFGNSRRKKSPFGDAININKFINKAVDKQPEDSFTPKYLFSDLSLEPLLKNAIKRRGFNHPTEIQEKTIPHILAGKDVIGIANTGTGKTGAFLIPIINKMLKSPTEKLLVVAPTRELAIQIQEEFVALTQGMRIYSVVVVGGASIHAQINKLRSRHQVIIGTPGRLKDLIQRKVFSLSTFNNIVLDEADRMLDMGFINDMKFLLSLAAPKRQTLFFSATISSEIENLISTFLVDPVRVSVKTRETAEHIDQDIVRVEQHQEKIEILHELLVQSAYQKVLIFTRTKFGAEKLSQTLYKKGFKTESIHGDKPHGKRQKALKMFKENHVEILVATDVAARGLDIPNVSHVINYDIPATYDDYIHRIGRTGRANNKGIALTFVQ